MWIVGWEPYFEDLILTNFGNDWVKIVDFLIKADFWVRINIKNRGIENCKFVVE